VISRQNDLHNLAQSGDAIDAVLSRRLLISVFNKYSPLHDGAVLVRDNRIIAARCILPVSERNDLPANFGLRHRAALGITEATDAVVLIVSEETGQVSIAHDGKVDVNLSPVEIRNLLNQYLNMPVTIIQESNPGTGLSGIELAPSKSSR
jgi:DNA integrity scanning protein DisA with diadenylate cyclase activity